MNRTISAETLAKQRKQKAERFKISRDLKKANKLMEKFNLLPETRTIDDTRAQETSDIITRRKAAADAAMQRDPEMARMLEVFKGGLGGLTSEQNTMARERGEQGLDTSFMTNLRALSGAQRGSGVRGAAAQAGVMDMGRDRMTQQRGLERDLQLENINVQDRRRGEYGGFLNNLLGTEFSQRQGSLNALESTVGLARGDELNRELFNIGQGDKSDALRGSTMFGLVGLRGSRRATQEAVALERERLEMERANAQKMYEVAMQQAEAYKGMMGGM